MLVGHVEYCITYDNGEIWSESIIFRNIKEFQLLMSPEYCEAQAGKYKAKHLYPVGVRVDGEDLTTFYLGVAI